MRALNGVGTATAADLTWRDSWVDAAPPGAIGLPDLIIGTDIVYFAELVEPLVQTLVALAGPATVILIANERRIPRFVRLAVDAAHPHAAAYIPKTWRHPWRPAVGSTRCLQSERRCTLGRARFAWTLSAPRSTPAPSRRGSFAVFPPEAPCSNRACKTPRRRISAAVLTRAHDGGRESPPRFAYGRALDTMPTISAVVPKSVSGARLMEAADQRRPCAVSVALMAGRHRRSNRKQNVGQLGRSASPVASCSAAIHGLGS